MPRPSWSIARTVHRGLGKILGNGAGNTQVRSIMWKGNRRIALLKGVTSMNKKTERD